MTLKEYLLIAVITTKLVIKVDTVDENEVHTSSTLYDGDGLHAEKLISELIDPNYFIISGLFHYPEKTVIYVEVK